MDTWYDADLHRFHGVFLALTIVHTGVFLGLYGDVYLSFPSLFKQLAILEGLVLANQALRTEAEGEGESSSPESPPEELPRQRVIRVGL
jgi:hypothetical protein